MHYFMVQSHFRIISAIVFRCSSINDILGFFHHWYSYNLLDIYIKKTQITKKVQKIRRPEKYAVITLKFEQDGFTEE